MNHDPLRSTFDLAFALLLVFVVISAIFMISNKKYLEVIEQNQFRNNTQYIMGENDLFNQTEYQFKDREKAYQLISAAMDSIYKVVIKYKENSNNKKTVKSILIIGHTDNFPIMNNAKKSKFGRADYDNWNLSLDRAKQIVNLLVEEKLLDKYPEFKDVMILPAGKAFYYPSLDFVKEYLSKELGVNIINEKDINYAFEDEIWNYICLNYSKEQINKLIKYCNNSEEKRTINRRVQIRLEI